MALPNGPYNPQESEKEILNFWLSNKFFKPEYNSEAGKVESTEELKAWLESNPDKAWALICPPPNAYARPHIGNISGYAYQDAMARYARMQGKRVLVLPGKDHAGLEGEGVFVREVLEKQNRNKFDMQREDFYKEMMEFFAKNMDIARNDEKGIGLSADFDRDTFTLDPAIVEIVLDTFVEMYKDNRIYKGVRIVNWDPKARSVIADNQCIREEREGKIYYIKYPIKDSSEFLTVATTRPETMFGDTAVAVNPSDKRFKDIIGKTVVIPLTDIEIPIISSHRVLTDFGTGALKITPAHAQDDYQIMTEWNQANPNNKISYRNVIDKDLKMVGTVPEKYLGRKYKEVLTEILEDLKSAGLLEKEETIKQNILVAERTRAIVEPMISSQWYLKYDGLKEAAIEMVKNGEVKIHPDNMVQKFNYWMENLRDWAISRSLWWGYRLPVWYAGNVKEIIDEHGEVQELINVKQTQVIEGIEIGEARESEALDIFNIGVQGWQDNFVNDSVGLTLEKLKTEFGKDFGNKEWVEKTRNNIKDPNFKFFVARNQGKVIGWITIENLNSEDINWLDIYIDRQWRNKKIGTLLMNKLISEFGDLELHVASPAQSKAVDFYKKKGFVEYDRNSKNIYGLPMVQLKLKAGTSGWESLDYSNPNHLKVQKESPGEGWIQDDNVLDTWFSSGQWVYATLTKYNLMDTFFPTDVLVSASDILENWDSRMMMFTYFKHKNIPFKNLFLTGLVLGKDGQKMSKSRGNIVDIDKVKAEYGSDALRLAYFYQNSAGGSYVISDDKLKNFKNFNNKIWNATRLVLSKVDEVGIAANRKFEETNLKLDSNKAILDHIQALKKKVTDNIANYEFGYATESLYQEFWHTFCDLQLEEAKKYLNQTFDKETKAVISEPNPAEKIETTEVLLFTLKEYLRMLHPFIPFITEKIWQELPKAEGEHQSLMYTRW